MLLLVYPDDSRELGKYPGYLACRYFVFVTENWVIFFLVPKQTNITAVIERIHFGLSQYFRTSFPYLRIRVAQVATHAVRRYITLPL